MHRRRSKVVSIAKGQIFYNHEMKDETCTT
jgi:hypothetical protein